MAIHAVYTLARLGKDKFINACFAHFTLEAMRMIRVISGHDSLVKNWQVAHIATVRTVRANG